MPKLLIIADDLTGAIDTGVQFAEQQISTLIIPELSKVEGGPFDCEVLVINTETRHCSPSDAADAVIRAAAFGQKHGILHFYKKTDSTLRGNLGAEFQALMNATGDKKLFFVPAFPQLQRVTRNGRQYVNCIELHKSEFSNDPLNPILTSDISSLLEQQAQLPTHLLAADLNKVSELKDEGVYIFDCESVADLRSIAATLRKVKPLTTLAGSAGFAPSLKDLLHLNPAVPKTVLDLPARTFVVNGSLNPAARRQLTFAARNGFIVTQVNPSELVGDGASGERAGAVITENILRTVRSGKSAILTTDPDFSSSQGVTAMLAIADRVGELASAIVSKAGPLLLIVFGGDTLSSITRSLHCRRIIPIAEVLPGIALSRFESRETRLFVVSKAGGFGTEEILPAILEPLRRFQ